MSQQSDAEPSDEQIPGLDGVDHIHVFVTDRKQAEDWYRQVLGFRRIAKLESWASDGGPLTVADASGNIHLALFERTAKSRHATVALKVDGDSLLRWQAHLTGALDTEIKLVDHELSWSIYFSDPYGNPYEITTYEYERVARQVQSCG